MLKHSASSKFKAAVTAESNQQSVNVSGDKFPLCVRLHCEKPDNELTAQQTFALIEAIEGKRGEKAERPCAFTPHPVRAVAYSNAAEE